MTLTKADIIERMVSSLGLENKLSSEILEYVLEVIKLRLADGEDVSISGFGKWTTREKNSRVGRNPKTGEEVEISARRVVTFKPSKILRDAVN